MAMKTSPAGRAALTVREGCRLTAYQDSVGVCTIGVGHSSLAPSGVKPTPGMCITRAEADAILADDLAVFEAAVNHAVTVPMTQNQFDACVSLAFNIGVHGFTGSSVVRDLNRGDVQAAADAFLMWEKPRELAQRRIGERAQFLTKDVAPAIALTPNAPVLDGIETAINRAADGSNRPGESARPVLPPPIPSPGPLRTAPYTPPAVAGPHQVPAVAKPGFWGWLAAAFGRKAT